MDKDGEKDASTRRSYLIFVVIGLALIVLGAFDLLLDSITSRGWTANGINADAFGMIANGALAITVAGRFFNQVEGTVAPPDSWPSDSD